MAETAIHSPRKALQGRHFVERSKDPLIKNALLYWGILLRQLADLDLVSI